MILGLLTVFFFVSSCLTLCYLVLRHEPSKYMEAVVSAGPERIHHSDQFWSHATELFNSINSHRESWQAEFTDRQINSWLAEGFIQSKFDAELPPSIHEPRVRFTPGKVFFAFRYGDDDWNSVVSIEAKVRTREVEKDVWVLVLQFEDFRLGAMPLSPKMIQDQISTAARKHNMDVQWYRNEGKLVAVVRVQANQRNPTFHVDGLEIGEGTLFIKGRSKDPAISSLTKGLEKPRTEAVEPATSPQVRPDR
jgi:hypothetical protein